MNSKVIDSSVYISLFILDEFYNMIMSDDRFIILPTDITGELFFWQQHKKKISYADSSIIHTAIQHKSEIITFDKQMLTFYKNLIS